MTLVENNKEKMTAKQFMCYVILKYSEIRDYLQLIKWRNSIATIIKSILKTDWNDNDLDTLTLKVLEDPQYSDIDFHLESATPESRVKNFVYLLKETIKDTFDNTDEYYENRKILEDSFQEYQGSFALKQTDADTFASMLENNQIINLNKFTVLSWNDITKVWQATALAARYWVGKTVWSIMYIKDVIESNNKVCVLYFGSSEVNKEAFLKRMMVVLSNEPINDIFKSLAYDKDLKRELEMILSIFDMDKVQSLKYLSSSMKVNKYYDLLDEDSTLDERIKRLSEEIKKITDTTGKDVSPSSDNIKNMLKKKSSEISSLQLKKNDNIKTLVNYLTADEWVFKIIKKLWEVLKTKEDFQSVIQDESNLLELKDEDFFMTLDFWLENWRNHTINYIGSKIGSIANVLTSIVKMEDFIKYLISKEWNKFYTNEIRSFIKDNYIETIQEINNAIKNKQEILNREYNKVLNYLSKEHVEIRDNLNINYIENQLRKTREKFPDHKITFVIDYQQKVEGLVAEDRASKSEALWKIVGDLAVEYQAFWVLLSQLNDFAKDVKGKISYSTRPAQSNLRDGEWLAQGIGGVWMIFNRDFFSLPEDVDASTIDLSFVIYEIYMTKNRYWSNGYNSTKQYFIFDKKKMSYLPVSRKYYQILDTNKDIIYLDQLIEKIRIEKWVDVNLTEIVA